MALYLGLFRVGMAEASGRFVADEINIVSSGQRLKFGESRESSQLLSYGESHVQG